MNNEVFSNRNIKRAAITVLTSSALIIGGQVHKNFDNQTPNDNPQTSQTSLQLDEDYYASLGMYDPDRVAPIEDQTGSLALSVQPTPQATIELKVDEPSAVAKLQTPEATQPSPIPQAEESDRTTVQAARYPEFAKITGYYCEQIPGSPIGDGGGYCGATASGEIVRPGIAACGSNFALGTKVEIEGVGEVDCKDRGLLAPHQIDIFFPTNKELYEAELPSSAPIAIK